MIYYREVKFTTTDWLETARAWEKAGHKIPPVMITVANRVETAARVEYAFTHQKIHIDELSVPERILHIDSGVLAMAEEQDKPDNTPAESEPEEDEVGNPAEKKLSKKDRQNSYARQ